MYPLKLSHKSGKSQSLTGTLIISYYFYGHVRYVRQYQDELMKSVFQKYLLKEDEVLFADSHGDTLWLCQNSYGKSPSIVDLSIENSDFP